ncbi:MAG: DCL family protein [Parvibaculaceae bacterium]|nr:DCL family protein [Parvibaculaceae bacterium]
MPAKPISFGSLHFAKKGDAEEYLKVMLYKYDLGDKVSADDAAILMGALVLHPEATEKIGCGISHFSVRSGGFGTRCFWVNRTDGTTEDFSFRTCIYG